MGHKFPKEEQPQVVDKPEEHAPVAPVVNFQKALEKSNEEKPEEERQLPGTAAPAVEHAGKMVNAAFDQAVVAQVENDENLQKELLDGAKQVIENKVNAIKDEAEREDKAAHFNNKKDACECFGYSEKTTEKWAVNYMNAWHNVFNGIWITIGMVTFAPITFIGRKLKVIFKHTWLAMVIAVIIYLAVVFVPILMALIKSKTGM